MTPWEREIAAAQEQTQELIGGVEYERIRYGDDFPDATPKCRDCGTRFGNFHVVGCCIERCPVCRGQAFGCSCYVAAEGTQ